MAVRTAFDTSLLAALSFAIAACGARNASPLEGELPPGLRATPRWLAFECVEPGCDTVASTTISQQGERRLAIKRIVLDSERTDFVVSSSRAAPLLLGPGESISIDVRHVPTGMIDPAPVSLLVSYTDAATEEEPGRAPPGELRIPLLRRLVGEGTLQVEPSRVLFGAVAAGSSAAQSLTVTHAGVGNVPLAVQSVESTSALVTAASLPEGPLVAGSSDELTLLFSPVEEAYTEAVVTIRSSDPHAAPTDVLAIGTSLTEAELHPAPAAIDFGSVPRGQGRELSLAIENHGGTELTVSDVSLRGTSPGLAAVPEGSLPAVIAPLAALAVRLPLAADTAGPIEALLSLTSSDPDEPVIEVPVRGLVTLPRLVVEPAALDFGNVARDFVVSRPVTLANGGYGPLLVENVTMVLGSSETFRLAAVPELPLELLPDQRALVTVEFEAAAEAAFSGTLSIESSDPEASFTEVPISATGTTCELGCVMPHATPSCATGSCAVGACEAGWHDVDGRPESGCECDDASDPGAFCAEALYLGSLSDNPSSSASRTGALPSPSDVDFIRVFGHDTMGFNTFKMRIRLVSQDAGIRMCVYRHATDSHTSECFLEGESCPGSNYYEVGASLGTDSADFVIRIFRDPGSAATCTPYSLVVENG